MMPMDEAKTVVWCDEMANAWGVAAPLIAEGETVQARMAFTEAYRKAIGKARREGIMPKWWPSFGHDAAGREAALLEAVGKGRISQQRAQGMLLNLSHAPLPAVADLASKLLD